LEKRRKKIEVENSEQGLEKKSMSQVQRQKKERELFEHTVSKGVPSSGTGKRLGEQKAKENKRRTWREGETGKLSFHRCRREGAKRWLPASLTVCQVFQVFGALEDEMKSDTGGRSEHAFCTWQAGQPDRASLVSPRGRMRLVKLGSLVSRETWGTLGARHAASLCHADHGVTLMYLISTVLWHDCTSG
jgi:hypothetical protein